MLPEAMTALAAAGGTAVVQAASTDAWAGFRQQVAHWFGRGDEQRTSTELERLDRTAGELEAAAASGPADSERACLRAEAGWQARIEALLEDLATTERAEAAEELQGLVTQYQGTVSAGQGGLAVGGDMNISAEDHSVAAGVINGGAHISPPPAPDPAQG
ncbi:hypothetical protein [Streptomyces sp. NBC_01013]|uniref:hypothetical protein n=1 Tax=Streptomyces sp. NBC_01013 TaxID=2903718 RepID=UPI00386E4A12|nr:hypothetical protein OG538_35665 [Streptomyces sp. NBC_01013]